MSNPRTSERALPERPRRGPGAGAKVYRRPELTSYGSVAQLIRGQASTHNGDFNGGATKMCWIAEALYGVDTPRTLLVRAWLTAHYERGSGWARIVVPIYRRWGRVIGRAVGSNATIRCASGRLFDAAVRQAHREYARAVRPRTPGAPPS
jgi:hypothetical protein